MNNNIITVDTDAYGRSKEFTAFICNPARQPITQINGITEFNITYKFNDISTISFTVSRYVENATTHETVENLAYTYLRSFCEIYVPELGNHGYFIINEEPTISAESTINEEKSFEAQSYESILMYENLVLFDINMGTETSREIWDDTEGETGFPQPIRLYYPENTKLSLLHLILEDDNYGWSVGHVDQTISDLERSFSIDNQNVYSVLREDVCKAFRCIIDFDTVNKTINVYDIETVGSDSNVYLGFENYVSKVNVQPTTSSIYTVFNVAGADGLDISEINFGSNKIYDISYPLSLCDSSLASKYQQYVDNRESLRQSYEDLAVEYASLQDKMSSIMDRQPDDSLANNWASPLFTLEELQDELDYDRWYVTEIENEYTDGQGHVDWDALNTSLDAGTYYSFRLVAIPDLMAEIAARQAAEPYTADKVDQEFVWNIYGLNDLLNEQDKLREGIQLYKDGGFDDPVWDPEKKIDEDSYYAQYYAYLNLLEKQIELSEIIEDKFELRDQIEEQQNDVYESMAEIGEQASLEYSTGAGKLFTEEEAAIITSLYRESDYNDDNYLITQFDDTLSEIAVEKELIRAAEKRLEIESRPQITWSISTDDLFAIEEFKPLRDNLNIGDFIILGFGKEDIIPVSSATFQTTKDGIVVITDGDSVPLRPNDYMKLRIVEFEFSGLKTDDSFKITFSSMTNSKYQNNDYESLLNDYITSRTNSIAVRASTSAQGVASKVAASLIRPYIQIMRAQIDEANITKANIDEIKGVWGHFETLLVDYLTVAQADISYAQIDMANVGMIASRDLDEHGNPTSWWNLDTGEVSLGGYLISSVTEYAISNSADTPPSPSATWSTTKPTPATGEYVWQRIVLIDGAGDRHPSTPVCINGVPGAPGAPGEDGDPALGVSALSNRGLIFNNDTTPTDIDVTLRYGAEVITSRAALRDVFGQDAKIVWKIKQAADSSYTTVPDSDERISNYGFRFTMSPSDIEKSATLVYEVWA